MESPGHTVGEYRINALLGKSERGAVYRAVHENSGEEVVIRFFIPAAPLGQAVLRRFEHGAENLKKLEHPNLIEIRSAGIYRGAPYLVSSYLPGDTLRQKLTQPLPWAQAARLLHPVAKALAYLHAHYMPHLNVCPENILLGKGFRLADAGVQQLVELIDLQSTKVERDGVRQDIRDLGCVYYEMITGRPLSPDAEVSPEQVRDALLWLREQHPDLPPAVEKLLRSALLPGRAFEQMNAFAQALEMLGRAGAQHESLPERGRQPVQRAQRKKKSLAVWLIPVTLLVFASIVAGVLLLNDLRQPVSTAVQPQETEVTVLPVTGDALPAATETQVEIQQSEVVAAPSQPTATPEPEPTLGIGSVIVSEPDGMQMVYVPAGEFRMGSDDREEDEKPMHNIYLDAFWIDRTEVTNGMYARCVQAGACKAPVSTVSSRQTEYYNNPDFVDYPVIYVTWQQADAYCTWAGRRLPTEAEWEKAARGTDGAICPWGNTSPAPDRLNYGGLVGDTTRIGSYPAGASVYGALDLSGNVWEWVADWYSRSTYSRTVSENPTGPEEGTRRVLRGGSWYYELNDIRSANRFSASENTVLNDVGFRCVLPAQ